MEHRLEAKTLEEVLPRLETFVLARHSYDVGEIIAHKTCFASTPYARWVRENVG
jgi:uncharacterized protein involved in tolerance to divalent cations